MNGRSSKQAMKRTRYQYRGLAKDNTGTFDSSLAGPVQIQNVKSARVYVFGDADVDEEEILNDETETHELQRRNKFRNKTISNKETNTLMIERPILKGETLQKIAVKYSCEVAELKRINNLLKDQDFFALTTIKVPVLKYGLVREELEEEIRKNASSLGIEKVNGSAVPLGEASGTTSEVTEANITEDGEYAGSDVDQCEPLVRTVSIRNSFGSQSKEAQNFLRRMDADIKNILTSTKSSKKRNLEDVRNSLICRRIYPMNHKEGYFGADCGMKLGTIIAIIVIVAVVTPLMYFLYYKYLETSHEHHPDGS